MQWFFDRDEVVKEAIEQGTKLVQAVADALFSLPSTEDPDGPIVKLPAPTTKLPREKPVSSLFAEEFLSVASYLGFCLDFYVIAQLKFLLSIWFAATKAKTSNKVGSICSKERFACASITTGYIHTHIYILFTSDNCCKAWLGWWTF